MLKNEVPFDSVLIFGLPAGILLGEIAASGISCEARTQSGVSEFLPCQFKVSRLTEETPAYITELKVLTNQRSFNIHELLKANSRSEIIIHNALNADYVKDKALLSG